MKYCIVLSMFALGACSKPVASGGDGPSDIVVPVLRYATDSGSIERGNRLFTIKGCAGCHSFGRGKLIGPDLQGVTARRTLPWLERMILKPEVMIREDPAAKALFGQYMAAMGNQSVDPETELGPILSFLKAHE